MLDFARRYAHNARSMSATNSKRKRVAPWVGPWLQERRIAAGVDRATIAKELHRDLSAVSRLERGDSSIPADDLPVVLKAYGATAGEYAAKARKLSIADVAA